MKYALELDVENHQSGGHCGSDLRSLHVRPKNQENWNRHRKIGSL